MAPPFEKRVAFHAPYACPSCGAPLRPSTASGPVAWFSQQTEPGSLRWRAVWPRDSAGPQEGGSLFECPSPACGALTRHGPPRATAGDA
jgi:hypothetical protein